MKNPLPQKTKNNIPFASSRWIDGSWSTVFTALFLTCLFLFFTGCRKPTLPTNGWSDINVLLPLHPDYAMLQDIDQRIVLLTTLREHLAPAPPGPLPAKLEQSVAALSPLPAPPAIMPFVLHTDILIQQEIAAIQRAYDRDLSRKLNDTRLNILPEFDAELRAALAKLDATRTERHWEIQKAHAFAIKSAEFAVEMAQRWSDSFQQFATTAHPIPAEVTERLAAAKEKFAQETASYTQAIAEVDAQISHAKAEAKEQNTAAAAAALAKKTAELTQAQQQQIVKERSRIMTEFGKDPPPPPETTISFHTIPSSTLAISAPGLRDEFTLQAQRQHLEAQSALQSLEQTITALAVERRQLVSTIRKETKAAATAVAAQHGYRVSYTGKTGSMLTKQISTWLQQYWSSRL